MQSEKGVIHCLTIIGQVEGHQLLPENSKSTKYEHVMPLLAAVEESEKSRSAYIAEHGGRRYRGWSGHSRTYFQYVQAHRFTGAWRRALNRRTLAVAADRSFIAPSAAMTIHPVRLTGLVIGVPQTFNYFAKIQERIVQFVTQNSKISRVKFIEYMMRTGELANDVGSVIYGQEAVECGLIDCLGGLSDALAFYTRKSKDAGRRRCNRRL